MKKILVVLLVALLLVSSLCFTACGDPAKTITVCASELPHADILKNCVADILKQQGYTLKVKVIDWEIQNDAVAQGDYDANYFQHVPYLETYAGSVELFATCKVHYEPLGIYKGGKYSANASNDTIAICNDESNAVRALQLLYAKGYITELPVQNEQLTFNGDTVVIGDVTIKLIAENLLVAAMPDYTFVCLPCNTALTGNVDQSLKVDQETATELVAGKANVLAARLDDYNNDAEYKAKIDALTNALLSKAVSDYVAEKWGGAITCDGSTQIDLRN